MLNQLKQPRREKMSLEETGRGFSKELASLLKLKNTTKITPQEIEDLKKEPKPPKKKGRTNQISFWMAGYQDLLGVSP